MVVGLSAVRRRALLFMQVLLFVVVPTRLRGDRILLDDQALIKELMNSMLFFLFFLVRGARLKERPPSHLSLSKTTSKREERKRHYTNLLSLVLLPTKFQFRQE